MKMSISKKIFKDAIEHFPGGVNSPVRAFKAVDSSPIIVNKGEGPFILDVDKNRYVDFIMSWGPLILGHAHPYVVEKVKSVMEKGFSFGLTNPWEIHLAEKIKKFMPHIEKLRFVNSGTEATMSAIRLARGVTGRDYIVKFNGCYHGHADYLLVKAGSGVATLSLPGTPGVPEDFVKKTIVLEYNDIDGVRRLFNEKGKEIAAVIVEPVAGNMGVVKPVLGFLEALREITEEYGTILIFDEVMTGFRIAPGGATELTGIVPDLVTLGKVIGGGFPVGAYGGKKELMENVAPEGEIYQAGTLSGNPVAMAAGWATLDYLERNLPKWKEVVEMMETFASEFLNGEENISYSQVGTMFTIFFTGGQPKNFKEVSLQDKEKFAQFFKYQLEHGVLIPPSGFEANFLSLVHSEDELRLYWENLKSFLK